MEASESRRCNVGRRNSLRDGHGALKELKEKARLFRYLFQHFFTTLPSGL